MTVVRRDKKNQKTIFDEVSLPFAQGIAFMQDEWEMMSEISYIKNDEKARGMDEGNVTCTQK
jgi:hypothetical protein